jgi:hypothetical protein
VWLVYTQIRKPRVLLYPKTPVVIAHRQLGEPRFLTSNEVEAFSVEAEVHSEGSLALEALSLDFRGMVQQELAALDPRLERVVGQQYMRLAVVRRDVIYQMCGTSGTISFSGSVLTGASTKEALRPIRRRLILWPITFLILGFGGVLVAGSAMGKSAYFDPSNNIAAMLWLGGTILSVPWIGGLLRSWRPLLQIRGLRPVEIGLGLTWPMALLAIMLVGFFAQPKAAAVEEALAVGDIERARVVLDALVEREGESASVLEIEDAVLMAEADVADGEERLAKLDVVISHNGAQASAARELARAERLAKIRGLVGEGHASEAIAAIDHDFAATWRDDPEIAEERAQAQELGVERCSDDPCRLIARVAAREAHKTPTRIEAVEDLRERLLVGLAIDRDGTLLAPVERVQTSDEVDALAGQVLTSKLDDEALSAAAKAAKSWAAEERAAIPILGADLNLLRALFPGIHESAVGIASVSLEGAEIFFSLDANGECRGVYAVGPINHRELDASHWSAQRILSQTLGQPVTLVPAKDTSDISSTWKEGKTKIVVRRRGGVPIELRIGDATP